MWINLTVVDETDRQTVAPINMDNVVTYAVLQDPEKYPNANAVVYPAGGFIQTLPVKETPEEIDALLEQAT